MPTLNMWFKPRWTPAYEPLSHKPTSLLSIPGKILSSTAFRILVATGIGWVLVFLLYKHHLFWREPHSNFFDETNAYDLHYSAQRQALGADLLSKAIDEPEWSPPGSTDAPVICAAIATVKRQINYLNGTIGTMLATLTDDERSAVDVRLTFVSTHPEDHPDWNAPWMKLVDYHGAYNASEEEMEQLRTWEADMKWIQWKGVWDYAYLLQDCYDRSTAPYIAVFEDDIVFAEGWLSKSIKALGDLRAVTHEWIYLRLFYTETYHVFWMKEDYWHKHRQTAYMIGACVTAVVLFLLRSFSRTPERRMSKWTLLVIACVTVPALMNLGFLVPKHYLIPGNGLTRMEGACCTQALIFPRSQVLDVIDYLHDKERGQTDLFIEKYAEYQGLARYAVEPQQVQHVGTKSSRGVNGISTWAYWFETYDSEKLRKEHERLAWWGIWRSRSDGQNAG